MKKNTERVSAETILANEIECAERKNPNAFGKSKAVSVKHMQARGISDILIKRLLGIDPCGKQHENCTGLKP